MDHKICAYIVSGCQGIKI